MNPPSDVSEFRNSETLEFAAPTPRQFLFILFVYFGLQTLIRVLISGTIDLDESEQLILTQKFSWGYGSQPPLYTWIQMLFFKTFGVSVFALALFKNLLLFSIYAFTYLNVRFVTRSHLCGILGAISLLFIPEVVWESQRDLTHSVLATALVMITLFVFLRMRENSWRDYAVFGVCAGLGILSKYNYAAFLFGLIFSALTLRHFRPLILNKQMVLSLAVCLAVLSPHLLWALGNRELLTTTTYKFHQEQSSNFFLVAATGLGRLFMAAFFHIAPILLIFVAIFRKNIFSKSVFEKNNFTLFFLRKYGFVLGGLIIAVLILRITGFKGRWFEPIFISLPVLIFAIAQKWVERVHAKAIYIIGGMIALTVLFLIPGRILFAEKIKQTQLLNAPFRQMKGELNAAIPSDALIVADSKWVGGNLRLLIPEKNVITPELAKLYETTNRSCVAVWDATKSERPKTAFINFLKDLGETNLAGTTPVFVSENYQFHRAKKFRIGVDAAKN